MELEHKKIGFVLTGSFCTFSKTIPKMKELIKIGFEVIPIMSYNAYNLDTKFGKNAYNYYQNEQNDKNKAIEIVVKITSSMIHPDSE